MAKSYDQRMKEYKATCINHARMEVVYLKFDIASERVEASGARAKVAASWAFQVYPELREVAA